MLQLIISKEDMIIQLARQEFYTLRNQQNKMNKLKTLCNVNDEKDTLQTCLGRQGLTECVILSKNSILFLNDLVRFFSAKINSIQNRRLTCLIGDIIYYRYTYEQCVVITKFRKEKNY